MSQLNKLVVVLTFATLLSVGVAGANDRTHYVGLGNCMAYTAISNGFDGKSTISPFAEKTLSLLGDEFMFEASTLNISQADAQTFVVHRLVDLNIVLQEKGSDALKAEYEAKCEALAASLRR